jgi:hypothetical protein
MSEEKSNGHNTVTAEMVGLLREIRDGQQKMERHLSIMSAEMGAVAKVLLGTREDLGAFRDETRGELASIHGEITEIHHDIADANVRVTGTNERLDALTVEVRITNTRLDKLADVGPLKEKVEQLEARMVKLETQPARRPGARR